MTTLNPYIVHPPTLISFSGGRTSAYMLHQIMQAHGGSLPAGVHVTFANTGKERTETLDFVHECETRWGVDVAWLEYRYIQDDPSGEGKHSYCRVTYDTASRNGEPFAELIRVKSYLPNPIMRFCTTELKVRIMKKFMIDQGHEEWDSIIGLRGDEPVRVHRAKLSCARERWNNRMPLWDTQVSESDVMRFWLAQPFDLKIRQDEGNCDLCFLKGSSKIERLILERPESAAWWDEQEKLTNATFRKDRPSYANLLKIVQEQGRFDFGGEEFSTCNCTD